MRKRILYGSATLLMIILVVIVVVQGSFTFGPYAPTDTGLTFVFWAVSLLIFLLMVTLGFMLFRVGLKLYVERQSNREGSRLRTKMVVGALALTMIPLFFMVLFSYQILNRNLEKWFSRPVESERVILTEIGKALHSEMEDKLAAQAELLAALPEVRLELAGIAPAGDSLTQFCRQQNIYSALLLRSDSPIPVAACGTLPQPSSEERSAVVRRDVLVDGRSVGTVVVASRLPIDVALQQKQIERFNREYNELNSRKKELRTTSILMLSLIAMFIMFVATWIALFLSKQISVPIAALLHGAEQVSRGNLYHRVDVPAMDELASLVRGFNQMTRELEANSRELDARRRFTEAILESIPTGVISVASDGAIQRVNRALKGILGEAQVERARTLNDLFSGEDAAEIRYLMNRARRTGLSSRQLELRVENRARHLAITVSALEDKITSGFVMVIEDTSELLRAQKATAWNEVARRVAHEIKNPLTPIALSAERIQRQLARVELPADVARIVRECTETIGAEVYSVKSLVDEFSQFSRFPAAQPVRCDLNDVVESALAVFQGRLEGIDLHSILATDLPPVSVDREQFKRVVVNLIDNAAEAMQESLVKRLVIATQNGDPGIVELIVADTGVGLTPEQREKLFLPYFSTKNRGTGLGLAIVSHVLSDHNAHIRVEDNSPAGARFVIEIPVLNDAPDVPTTEPAQARTA